MRFTDEFRIRINGYQCVYCGALADTDEHFPPASLTRRGLIFPACRECNSFAGTQYAYSFDNRVALVKDKIRNKYRKLLRQPHWDEEDLSEMSPNFKETILKCEEEKEKIHSRLAWNAKSCLARQCTDISFAAILAECDTIINTIKPSWSPDKGFSEVESEEECLDFLQ